MSTPHPVEEATAPGPPRTNGAPVLAPELPAGELDAEVGPSLTDALLGPVEEPWDAPPARPPYDPAAAAVVALLEALGVPRSEHTTDTPRRVARSWRHALRGYLEDPRRHLETTFPCEPGAPLVVQSGIRVVSTCAHHLLPITGWATVAYRPRKGARIVGLSKLARLVEGYAARATVQEHIGGETARALVEVLDVAGAACIITAEHGCMSLRGVAQPAARTTTTSLAGRWTPTHADVDLVMRAHSTAATRV